AAHILALGLGFDASSIMESLGYPTEDTSAIVEHSEAIKVAKEEAEKQKKIQQIVLQTMKDDKAEAARLAKEAKQEKKNKEKQRRLEEQKRQSDARKDRRVLTVSGFNVDDITVIIPEVSEWLSKNDSIYLSGGLLAR